jgi:predicted amidohydrolase YtcJ
MIDSVSCDMPVLLNRWDRGAWLANDVALQRARLSCAEPVAGPGCVGGRATGRVSDAARAHVRGAIATKTFDQGLSRRALASVTAPQVGRPAVRLPTLQFAV